MGNLLIFLKTCCKKKSFKKSFLWKTQNVHKRLVWLNPLSPLAHLIVISPKSWIFFTRHIFVLDFFTLKSSFKFQWDGMTGMSSATLEHVESCEFSCQGWNKCNRWWIARCCCFTNNGDSFVCIFSLVCHVFSYYIIDLPWN